MCKNVVDPKTRKMLKSEGKRVIRRQIKDFKEKHHRFQEAAEDAIVGLSRVSNILLSAHKDYPENLANYILAGEVTWAFTPHEVKRSFLRDEKGINFTQQYKDAVLAFKPVLRDMIQLRNDCLGFE